MVALERKRVERIETARHRQRKRTAFGRLRINVIEMGKSGGIARLFSQAETVGGVGADGGGQQ